MKFSFATKFAKTPALIVPLIGAKNKFAPTGMKGLETALAKTANQDDFKGSAGEIASRFVTAGTLPGHIIFVALGKKEDITEATLLEHFANAVKKAKQVNGSTLSLFVPAELAVFGQAIGEAVTLANHSNILYKTGKAAKKIEAHTIKSVSVLAHKFEKTELATFKKDLEKGRLIAEAVNNVREWVTAPPNITTPELLEEIAVKLGKENGYKVTVFKKKQIEKMRMGGIIGVNQGSPKEARLLVLEHRPKGSENEKPVVIVGKGIIFDTGGINLKPTGYIEDMQLDMAGAAATIGLFQLLKKLDIKVPVVGITPVTENCISGTAQKPSEIITMYNGKTVEVGNTDAEGRLVLADALAYGVDIFKPRYLLDFATLTGACMVALGRNYAGLFSTDDDLTEGIKKAAQEIAEPVWPLPLHKEFNKAMRGEVTDLTNSSKDRYGGASKGAAFLQEFVGKAKWAHLDIAGPAFTEQPHSHQSKRGTGFGVRLALRFLENLATTDANMEE